MIVNSGSENIALPEGVDFASVRAGIELERSIVVGDVVDKQQGRDDIVVGMGGEGKILVPFDGCRGTGKLRINLGMVKFDVGPYEVGDGVRHARRGHSAVISRGYFGGRVHAAQGWPLGSMTGLEIKAGTSIDCLTIGPRMGTAFFNPGVEVAVQLYEAFLIDGIGQEEPAITPKPFFLR
jgi:hypothetical protein